MHYYEYNITKSVSINVKVNIKVLLPHIKNNTDSRIEQFLANNQSLTR